MYEPGQDDFPKPARCGAAMALALALGLAATPSPGQALLFAAPGGAGSQCSAASPCDLATARAQARAALPGAAGGVTVRLRGGLYVLDSTFTLDARDKGRPGARMTYEAAPGERPVLSGGRAVTGWTLYEAGRDVWRARVPASLRTRQIYVNDVRAVRARGAERPAGWVKTAAGYTAPDAAVSAYRNLSAVEVVSLREWKSFRCPIASASGRDVVVASPCWPNAQAHGDYSMGAVSWIENAYELLDAGGEWYLDEAEDFLYYKPRAGEDMGTARVTAASLEVLLTARGSAGAPLGYLTLRGLTFAHATWMKPSSPRGFPDLQGTYQWGDEGKALSALQFWHADSLVIERCAFRALGGNGPSLEAGTRDSRISCNAFFDISGNGLHVGNISANPDARDRNVGITLENNYVTRVGREFHGCAGIFLGYVARTRVLRNEVHDLPHMGISLGWGWGAASYMQGNEVAQNRIYDHMQRMNDGGGIYTLGPQPGTHVHHNYIHDQVHELGGLYPDEGSRFMRWDSNVVQNVPRWLHMWTNSIQYDTVVDNYYNNNVATLNGANCVTVPNHHVTGGDWPPAARRIMAEAGLAAGCQDVKALAGQGLATGIGRIRQPGIPAAADPKLAVDLREGRVFLRGWRGTLDLAGRRIAGPQTRKGSEPSDAGFRR